MKNRKQLNGQCTICLLVGWAWLGVALLPASAQAELGTTTDNSLRVGIIPGVVASLPNALTLTANGYYVQGRQAVKIGQLDLSRSVSRRVKLTAGYLGLLEPKVRGERNYDHRARLSATASGDWGRVKVTNRVLGEYRFRRVRSGYRLRNQTELAYPLTRQERPLIVYGVNEPFYDSNRGGVDSDLVTVGLRKVLPNQATVALSVNCYYDRKMTPLYLLFTSVVWSLG